MANNPGFIDQIDALELPKRVSERRLIYVNETPTASLKWNGGRQAVFLVDVSREGVALLTPGVFEKKLVGQIVDVHLKLFNGEKTSFSAEVKNQRDMVLAGKERTRFGLKFDRRQVKTFDQLTPVDVPTVPCALKTRPIIYSRDSGLFFNDTMFFVPQSFASTGVIVLPQDPDQVLLPNQVLNMVVQMPSRGDHVVKVRVTDGVFATDRCQYFFLEFVQAEKEFRHAMSEYLVAFRKNVSPKFLRDSGFQVGNLEHSFFLSYRKPQSMRSVGNFQPTILGVTLDGVAGDGQLGSKTRKLVCHLGRNIVAVCGLGFCRADGSNSALVAKGHSLPDKMAGKTFTELRELLISDQVNLADFFIPLVRHLIRITYQDKRDCLVVECHTKLIPVLAKVGFKKTKSTLEQAGSAGKPFSSVLMYLVVGDVLSNKGATLALPVWNKIAKELSVFLKSA